MEARLRRWVVMALVLALLGGAGAVYYLTSGDDRPARLDLLALSAQPSGLPVLNDPRLATRTGDLSLAEASIIDSTTPAAVQATGYVAGYATWFGQLPGEVIVVELRQHTTSAKAADSVRDAATGPSGPSNPVAGVGSAKLHLYPPPTGADAWRAEIRFARGRVSARLTLLTRGTPKEPQLKRLETTAQAQFAKLPD